MTMLFLLMARHDGQPILPPEIVCKDYFTHLTPEKFLRKISDGTIPLPLARMEKSQKSAKGIFITDLAEYLDERRKEALREHLQLVG